MRAEPTAKRGDRGPTIRTAADYRRARDLLMQAARQAGYNRFDLALLFPITPDHANQRLRLMRAAVAHRESRRGL